MKTCNGACVAWFWRQNEATPYRSWAQNLIHYSHPLVSSGDWFHDHLWVSKSSLVQVPHKSANTWTPSQQFLPLRIWRDEYLEYVLLEWFKVTKRESPKESFFMVFQLIFIKAHRCFACSLKLSTWCHLEISFSPQILPCWFLIIY